MAELARRGLVVRRRGRKTIASQPAAMVVSGTEFSFGRSAKEHGARLFTRLLEKSCRLPNPGPEAEIEMRAQTALGLKRSQPFLVIARLRELNDRPRVIHRSYLNPINYPTTLLKDHDFQNESLMEILEKYGMLLRSRETRIRATLPTKHECEWLEVEEEPVLQVE
jgi:DNA-binding GntR family transcriptional regulator